MLVWCPTEQESTGTALVPIDAAPYAPADNVHTLDQGGLFFSPLPSQSSRGVQAHPFPFLSIATLAMIWATIP